MRGLTIGATLLTTLLMTGCMGEAALSDDAKAKLDDAFEQGSVSQEYELIDGTVTLDRAEIGYLLFNGGLCTTTLITPRVAITARHCVGYTSCDTASCAAPYRAQVRFQTSTGQTASYNVVAFESYDQNGVVAQGTQNTSIDYLNTRRSDYWLSDDVAIVLLDRDVPASVARPSQLAQGAIAPRADLTVWGYGCTARGGQSDGRKRYRDFNEGTRSNNLCPGDSGGPVTTGRQGGVRYVNSAYLLSRNPLDIFGDVDYFRTLIDQKLARWGQSIPTDPTDPGNNTPDPTPEPDPTPAPIVLQSSAPIAIPDGGGVARNVTLAQNEEIDSIEVDLEITHSSPLDLAFVLIGPNGQRVVFQYPNRVNSTTRSYTIDAFNGDTTQGTWRLEFYDVYRRDVGQVQNLALTFNLR